MRAASLLVFALLAAGCASAPVHYWTLLAPVPAQAPAAASPVPAALPAFELLPVGVPAQVDQPQLVVRQGEASVAVLDGQRWIAPLAEEVHNALAADLARALGSQDASGLPPGAGARLRIKLDLRRFDTVPGTGVMLEAAWSLRPAGTYVPALACVSRVQVAETGAYAALVAAHQRALDEIAARIATAARAQAAGTPACPPA